MPVIVSVKSDHPNNTMVDKSTSHRIQPLKGHDITRILWNMSRLVVTGLVTSPHHWVGLFLIVQMARGVKKAKN